jgi:hypothetical protein
MRGAAVLCAAWITSCSRPAAVHYTAAGTSVKDLILVRAKPRDSVRVRSVVVRRLGSSSRGMAADLVWAIRPNGGPEAIAPDTIRYGVAPPGFAASLVRPLFPGGYEVEVSVAQHITVSYFHIQRDGHASR